MIIDAHVHLGRAYAVASFEPFIFKTLEGPREVFGPEALLQVMDNLKIDMAVIMTTKPFDNRRENEEIAEVARRYPNRFVGFPVINPLKEDAVDELTRCVKEFGMKGLKLKPHEHCYTPYFPVVHPLIEQAIKLRIPVAVHSGTPPFSTPLQIAMVADMFPDATIIMAHMGGNETYALEAQYSAKKYDNIVLDTSLQNSGCVRSAIDKLGADRVVYGSDTPWTITEIELQKIKVLGLPEDEERLVLGENMARILGIKRK